MGRPASFDEGGLGLKQVLTGWQIFFIVISSTIGVTVFANDGEALEMAGPAGVLCAFVIVGVIAICVFECLSELIQMFPAPNALLEYVRAFVDPDLAWVVGIAYWYGAILSYIIQLTSAAKFVDYWGVSQTWKVVGLYVLAPIIDVTINFAGVEWFGWIETIGGALKSLAVIGGGILMYVLFGQNNDRQDYANDGFTFNIQLASSSIMGLCYVIPLMAYAFVGTTIPFPLSYTTIVIDLAKTILPLGLETIAICAFEARDIRSLRRPSRVIAYYMLFIYLWCAVGEFLNVKWTNLALPLVDDVDNTNRPPSPYPSSSIIVIACLQAGYTKLSGFVNGCIVFSALSASNSILYGASRTLYGMTRTISPYGRMSWAAKLGTVWHKNRVPMWALLLSAFVFIWLPFLQLKNDVAVDELVDILSTSASLGVLFVWACECLAFIRYHSWLSKHKQKLAETYPEFNRWSSRSQSTTFLAGLQPIVAWVGLIGSLLICFVFSTATWWYKEVSFKNVAVAFASPVFLGSIFILLKVFNKRGPVKLDDDSAELFKALEYLKWLKPDQEYSQSETSDAVESLNSVTTIQVSIPAVAKLH